MNKPEPVEGSRASHCYLIWRATPGKEYASIVGSDHPSVGYGDDGCRSCRVDLAENADRLADCLRELADFSIDDPNYKYSEQSAMARKKAYELLGELGR